MNILLVCPEGPETCGSFQHALRIFSQRALLLPLGLLAVAAMLPRTWQTRLVEWTDRRHHPVVLNPRVSMNRMWSLLRGPQFFPPALTPAVQRFHFRKVVANW
jgi:hypothetical protein